MALYCTLSITFYQAKENIYHIAMSDGGDFRVLDDELSAEVPKVLQVLNEDAFVFKSM